MKKACVLIDPTAYRPMLNKHGCVCYVHKDEILRKLKKGWTLERKSALLLLRLDSGEYKSKRIHLEGKWRDSEAQYQNLIEHLKKGWFFGVKKI